MYNFFQSLAQGFMDGISSIANWFGTIFYNFFNGLKSFFTFLFSPVILLFEGIWYLITSIFSIVVLVIELVLGLFHVVFAIVGGIFTTFGQLLGFTGSTSYYSLPEAYETGFNSISDMLNLAGFNAIAYIFVVFVWMATAYAVIKIAGGDN